MIDMFDNRFQDTVNTNFAYMGFAADQGRDNFNPEWFPEVTAKISGFTNAVDGIDCSAASID